jgi:hypothetical protein
MILIRIPWGHRAIKDARRVADAAWQCATALPRSMTPYRVPLMLCCSVGAPLAKGS